MYVLEGLISCDDFRVLLKARGVFVVVVECAVFGSGVFWSTRGGAVMVWYSPLGFVERRSVGHHPSREENSRDGIWIVLCWVHSRRLKVLQKLV